MFDSLPGFLKQLPDYAIWAAPVVGFLVCGLALFVGRRVFGSAPAPKEPEAPLGVASQYYRSAPSDRRAAPRRKGNSVEIQMRIEETETSVQGWVLDRSMGGLGILAEQAIAEGTQIRIRPRSTSESMPWTDVTVRSCRQDGANYELGCQFHRTPNWNMLLQFG